MIRTFSTETYSNKHFFLLVFFLLAYTCVSAQKQQHYTGNFQLKGAQSGTASFDFYLVGGDTIRNGDFRFQQFIEHFHDSDTIHGFVLNGVFRDNVKDGPWRYVSRNFTVSGNPRALDARVVYDVTGKEFLINSNFQQGRAHGRYEILDRHLVDSHPSDTSLYAQFTYEEGEVVGRIEGFTNDLKVEGSFDEEGFPNGDWAITHLSDTLPPLKEIRRYDHGYFSKHFFQIDEDLYEIKHIGFDTLARSGLGLLTRLPVTSTYFRALGYTNVVMDTTAIQQFFDHGDFQRLTARTNSFMERVMVNPAFHNDQNVWAKVEGSFPVEPMMIKVSKHTYSEDERSFNTGSELYLTEALSMIRGFLADPNIQIGRFSNENLALNARILQMYEDRLSKLSPVIYFLVDEASEYVDHSAILRHNIVDVSYPEQVRFDFGDGDRSVAYTFPPAITEFTIPAIYSHIELVFEDVSRLVAQSDPYLKDFKVKSNLNEKEQKLIQVKDSVLLLFADVDSSKAYGFLHREVRASVESSIDKTFKSYSTALPQHRILEIDSMIECYAHYFQLYDQLIDFENRLQEIDKEYTRSVWNAYTYTYMEERVKERLYKAFDETILPYYIVRLKQQDNCGDLDRELTRIEILLRRMMELRMEDTKGLERQLRRAPKTPEAYLAVLGLAS